MPMYNLAEYSVSYSKASESLWQHCRDEPFDLIVNYKSFKSRIKITGNTPNNDNKKNAEIPVPLE